MRLVYALALLALAGCSSGNMARMGFGDPAVVQSYDRFEDETRLSTQPFIRLTGGLSGQDMLEAVATCEGNVAADATCPPASDFVMFVVHADNNSWKYLHSHDVAILVDGERVALAGEAEQSGGVKDNGEVWELVTFAVPAATFTRMATAQSVSMRIGAHDFDLTPEKRMPLRMLAARLSDTSTPASR